MIIGPSIPFKKRLRIHASDMVYRKKIAQHKMDSGFRVLAYHSITDNLIDNEWEEKTIPKDLFDRQMKYLADNQYNIISCRQAIQYLIQQREVPPKTIAITFDDGYRNNYTNALPILKKYNFCVTIFLTVNFLRDYSGNREALSCSEIINIKKSGMAEFGSHGLTHRTLAMLDRQQLDKEIKGAKDKLESIVNERIDLFAYPFGHHKSYSRKVVKSVEVAGFIGACTTIFGLNGLKTPPFLLRRNRISWFDNLGEFAKHLAGAYDWYALYQRCAYKKCQF